MKSKKIPLSEVNITEEEEVQIVENWHKKKDLEREKKCAVIEMESMIKRFPNVDFKEVLNSAIDLINQRTEESIKDHSKFQEIHTESIKQLKKKLIKKI